MISRVKKRVRGTGYGVRELERQWTIDHGLWANNFFNFTKSIVHCPLSIVFTFIVVFFIFAMPINAASLNDLIEIAKSNNPEITAVKRELDAARAKVPQMLSLEDPKIGLEYQQIPSGSRNLEDGMKMYTAEQMIMFPGKIYADYLIAAKEADKYDAHYRAKILEISDAVKSAYYDLFYADRSIDALYEVKELLKQIKSSAISKYAVGRAPQTDALLANIEYLLMNNELKIMRQDRIVKETELKSLLNQTDELKIVPDKELNLPYKIENEDNIIKTALEMRPELLSMKAEIDMKEAQSLKAKMEFFPDLGLGVKKRVSGGWDAMITLSVPLYFWKQGYSLSSSGFEKSALAAEYINMKNMTISEVKDALVIANTSLETMKLYKNEIVPQSLSAVKISLSAYKAGKIDFQTVLQIEKTYREAKLKLFESQIKYGKAISKLERLTGKESL